MPRRPTGRPPGRPPYPDPLTPAEQRVLGLVRLGKTNPEIADELGIGVATVKFHVSNMLAKLELASREELAVWDAATLSISDLRGWARPHCWDGSAA